jgi:Flp pilus assembly protein TadD
MSAAEVFFEKGLLAIREKKLDRALDFLQEALKVDSEHAEAWMIRGNIEHSLGRPFNAMLHHNNAVAIAPNKYDAWNNRGLAFADLGLFKSAEECYRKSLELHEAYEPRINLANMYCHEMRLEDAVMEYRAAIEDDPGNLDAHTNLGITLLGLGHWQEGFKEYYYRHGNTPYPNRARRSYPEWRGQWYGESNESVGALLLYPEQGYGDELLFMRFAADQASRGMKVVLEARPFLYRLAKVGLPGGTVIHKDDDSPIAIKSSCAVMDVPMVLGTITPSTIPLSKGYLNVPYVSWIGAALPKGFRVGLCWSSGQRPLQPETESTFKMKSIPLEWLEPLVQPGVSLISLQKEGGNPHLMYKFGIFDAVNAPYRIVDDFLDTAAIINELDLVISVDTAVAHLAGAMGKPVWTFVRFNGYWPWLRDNRTTPWYDSMRLYRQPKLGDWNEPINRAAADLAGLVKQKEAA